MDIDDIKLKIINSIEKIQVQENHLSTLKDSLSVLDFDMQLMYIRELYDQYLHLKSLCFNQEDMNKKTKHATNAKNEEVESGKNKSQMIMASLFDSEDTTEHSTNKKEVSLESPINENQEINYKEKLNPQDTVQQPSKKEENEIPVPIEIDMDNIEFVEEEEDDEDVKETTDDAYNDNYFPQINPVIKDQEPDLTAPVTKETLQKTTSQIIQKESLSDKYSQEKKDLNAQYSTSSDNNVAAKFQKNQGNDLMKNIDINDKFLFIRELFNGNGSLFTEIINQMNQFVKLTDAIEFMEKTKVSYRWKENSEAYLRLYELLLKKYSNQS